MIWYPYEQMKTMKAPYKIVDADGVYLYTEDQKLIEFCLSWWCRSTVQTSGTDCCHQGTGRSFCHVMLGGLTHEPVQKLTQKLESFLPGDLNYCFYSDFRQCSCGSLPGKWRFSTTLTRAENVRWY